MAHNHAVNLIEPVEGSQLHVMPPLPGEVTWFGELGLRGRITTVSNATANAVLVTRLRAHDADRHIERMKARYADRNLAFGWVLSPASTPPGLGRRLAAHGIEKHTEAAGMVLADLARTVPHNPAVRIVVATPADVGRFADATARAYGIDDALATLIARSQIAGGASARYRCYMAFLPGEERPVGVAAMVALPDEPAVLMASAATSEQHRGNGVYSSLMARRLKDARSMGATLAIVQALATTSAPICERIGFEHVCTLEMYKWAPEV